VTFLTALRQHPRVRALARRHVHVLLARARTWANVDSALRLLAEDRSRPVAFGRCSDPLLDFLYWQPFVRWARSQFDFDRTSTVDAVTLPPEPVMALVEEYRRGDAAPRPLLKRTRYGRSHEPAPGGLVPWSDEALRSVLAGVPTVAIVPESGAVEPDLDLALRVAAELGGSLTILSKDHLTRLLQALHGLRSEAELEWDAGP
jgi:hypothetical protein